MLSILSLVVSGLSLLVAAALDSNVKCGLYFDWSPETGRYHGHVDKSKLPELPPPVVLLAQALSEGASQPRDPPVTASEK